MSGPNTQQQPPNNHNTPPNANTMDWGQVMNQYHVIRDGEAHVIIGKIETDGVSAARDAAQGVFNEASAKLANVDQATNPGEWNHFNDIKTGAESRLNMGDDELKMVVAEDKLAEARDRLAKDVVERTRNGLWFRKTGKDVNAGLQEGSDGKIMGRSIPLVGRIFKRDSKLDPKELTEDNSKFNYDVMVTAVEMLRQRAIENDASIDPANKEVEKKIAALDKLLGTEGNPNGTQRGEMFKLNDAILDQHKLQSGFYERRGDQIVEKQVNGKRGKLAEKWRKLNQKVGEKWNQFSQEGKKGIAKKAGASILAGVILGATVGATAGALVSAGAATRASKAMSFARAEKNATAVRAVEEHKAEEERLKQLSDAEYQRLAADPTITDLFNAEDASDDSRKHVETANERHNRNVVRIGATAAAGIFGAEVAGRLTNGGLVGHIKPVANVATKPFTAAWDGVSKIPGIFGVAGGGNGDGAEATATASATVAPGSPTPSAMSMPENGNGHIAPLNPFDNPYGNPFETPTPEATATPTATVTPSPEATPTATPEATATPTPTPEGDTGGARAPEGDTGSETPEQKEARLKAEAEAEEKREKERVERKAEAAKEHVISNEDMKGNYVAEVYEKEFGDDGFAQMMEDAKPALESGELKQVYPDPNNPNVFWFETEDGKTDTKSVMKVLARHSHEFELAK